MTIDELKSEIGNIEGGIDFLKEYLLAVGFTASDEDGDNPFDVGPGEIIQYIDWTNVWDVLDDRERHELLTDVLGFLRDSVDIVPADMIEQAARDFHFTRNGHGCGFWDGDWDHLGDDVVEKLCSIAKSYGSLEYNSSFGLHS
jgi:hypothetical protein